MTADTITAIKKALEGVTPGPWAWFGNGETQQLHLATTHSGRHYVMDFARWGMRGAQPRFHPPGRGMVEAKELLQFAVGDRTIVGMEAVKKDDSVYRYDVRGIDCPDARYIAAVNPEVITELLSTFDTYRIALKSIAANTCCDKCREAALVAQSALSSTGDTHGN